MSSEDKRDNCRFNDFVRRSHSLCGGIPSSLERLRSDPAIRSRQVPDCLVARAPRNDMLAHSRGAKRPSDAHLVRLRKRRAQGMPGAWPHPQPCVRKVKAHKHSHHRLAETFRHSLRDGFTVSSALSPVIGLFCTTVSAVRRAIDPADLIPASRRSGPHGFAVRWSMRSSGARAASIASRAPRS